MKKSIKKNYFEHLILETCLQFGQQTRYHKHKFNQYVFILRNKRIILSLYEMRLMFFKLYPLIHTLYASKVKNIASQQILFATTTMKYKTIIKEAATFCSMPFHNNRWTNGFISKNEQIYSLLIIPDLAQNYMILNEAKLLNIPTLGLVNSTLDSTKHMVDYAIFGNDKSSYVVNFFCQLLAQLIKKESIHLKYKKEIIASYSLSHIAKKKVSSFAKPSKKFLFFFLNIKNKRKEYLTTDLPLERKEWGVSEKSSQRKKSSLVLKYKNFLVARNRNLFSRSVQQWITVKLNTIKDFYKKENVEFGFLNTLDLIMINTIFENSYLKTPDIIWLNHLKNKMKQLPKLYFEGQKLYSWTKITKWNNPFYFGNLSFWEAFPNHKQDEYDKKTYDYIARQRWKLTRHLKYMNSMFLVLFKKKYKNKVIFNVWNDQFYIKSNENYNKRSRMYLAKHRFKYKNKKEQLKKKETIMLLKKAQYINKYGLSDLELKKSVIKNITKC